MSIKIMTRVWDTPLPFAEKLVLLALGDNANDEGFCYPSIATLGKKCGMSDRTVQRTIAKLVADGHVTVRAKPPRSNTYTVHPMGDSTQSNCQGVSQSPRQIVTPSNSRSAGVTQSPSPRQPVTTPRQPVTSHPVSLSPKSSSESSLNRQRTSEGGPVKVGVQEPEAVRVARALACLEQVPTLALGDLSRMFRVTVEAITKALEANHVPS